MKQEKEERKKKIQKMKNENEKKLNNKIEHENKIISDGQIISEKLGNIEKRKKEQFLKTQEEFLLKKKELSQKQLFIRKRKEELNSEQKERSLDIIHNQFFLLTKANIKDKSITLTKNNFV